MFSIELKSKGKVTLDLYALTVSEIRTIADTKKTREGDEILAKAVGMKVKELEEMPYPDYRKLTRFFWQCVTNPLKDEDEEKNSQSESISQ